MSMTPNDASNPAGQRGWQSPTSEAPPPSIRADLLALLAWRTAVLHPRMATFDAQVSAASWQKIGIGFILLAVVHTVSDTVAGLETRHAASASAAADTFIAFIVGFALFTGVWYRVGK